MTPTIKFRYLGRLFVLTADRLARLVLLLAMHRNNKRSSEPCAVQSDKSGSVTQT